MKVKSNVLANTAVSVTATATAVTQSSNVSTQIFILLLSVIVPPLITILLDKLSIGKDTKEKLRKQYQKRLKKATLNGDVQMIALYTSLLEGLGE